MDDQYLTTTQAAEILKVSRFSVLNWVKQGKLRAIATAGRHQRIPKKSITDFLRKKGMNNGSSISAESEDVQVRCWESKEVKASGRHHCAGCLVFKQKANRCFLTVKAFGNDKVHCNMDCLKCAYFAKHFPNEMKTIGNIRQTAVDKFASTLPRAERVQLQGFIQKSFFVSGKYFAKARRRLSGLKTKIVVPTTG